MQFRLALAQTRHPEDGDVLALACRMAEEAAAARADILVFPEYLMTPYEAEESEFIASAQPLDGDFSRSLCIIAKKNSLWTIFTMNEANPKGLPFNTAVVVGSDGVVRGKYRKLHLFDTSATQESQRMSAGDAPFDPVETPFGKLGLGICYDLRFPRVARHAARDGCTLFAYPSAWVDGPEKLQQWHTLLAARALENKLFVAGVCRCDEGYIGHSAVYGPDSSLLAEAGSGEELLVCELDTADLE